MDNILYVSFKNNLWIVHTDKEQYGKPYILRSTAVSAAVKLVADFPGNRFRQIRLQNVRGFYKTIWTYSIDTLPPAKPSKKK